MTNFCFCSVFFQKMPTYAFSYTIKQHNESFLNSWGGYITQLKKTLTCQKKVSKIAKSSKKPGIVTYLGLFQDMLNPCNGTDAIIFFLKLFKHKRSSFKLILCI